MSVSAITRIVSEGFSHDLDAFTLNGVEYIAWTSNGGLGVLRTLSWRDNTLVETAKVEAQYAHPYVVPSVLAIPSQGALLVVCQGDASNAPQLYVLRFNLTTGARLSGPTWLAAGARPRVMARPSAADVEVVLTYANLRKGAVYVRRSIDGGQTWLAEQPVLNQKVVDTAEVTAVPFDANHISIAQVGTDGRVLVELGSLTRTRPLTAILKHPTAADRVLVAESSNRNSELADNLRGRIIQSATDEVVVPTRTRVGADDGIGDLALLDVSGMTPAVVVSQTLPAGGNGISRVVLDGSLTVRATIEGLFGNNAAVVDADVCSSGRVLVAGYSDLSNVGGLALVLANNTFSVPDATALMRAVAIDAGCNVTASARTLTAGGERLVLGADPSTPSQYTHKLPARGDEVLAQMTDASNGVIYVATADRLLAYEVKGIGNPISLRQTLLMLTRGRFMRVLLTPGGNLLCALGEGGLAVYAPGGECLAQIIPSTFYVAPWQASKAYGVGDFTAPTASSTYARARRYFRCTQAGASAKFEPAWGPGYTVVDGGARWVEQGTVDPVVTDVCYDYSRKRIYAVGVLGGATGTQGRVWAFDGRWLL